MDTNAIIRYKLFGKKEELSGLVNIKEKTDIERILASYGTTRYAYITPKILRDLQIPIVTDGHIEMSMYNKTQDIINIIKNPSSIRLARPTFSYKVVGKLKDELLAIDREANEE